MTGNHFGAGMYSCWIFSISGNPMKLLKSSNDVMGKGRSDEPLFLRIAARLVRRDWVTVSSVGMP